LSQISLHVGGGLEAASCGEQQTSRALPQREKILVVEDDELISGLLEMALVAEGYDVVLAADGNFALALLLEEPFGVILLDLMMPNLGGFEFMKRLREDMPSAPSIIVMSGSATAEVSGRAIASGARSVLRKPVDTDELLRSIKAALAETNLSLAA